MQIFISYTSEDKEELVRLTALLRQASLECVEVTDCMRAGNKPLSDQLRGLIEDSDVCIFIATNRSVRAPWCLAELGAFWGTGKTVIVYIADESLPDQEIPIQFRKDFWERDIEKVVETAKDELERSRTRPGSGKLRTSGHVLAIGHTCLDTIIDQSGEPRVNDEPRAGGSTLYGTRAMAYMADQMRCQVSIDLVATLGDDHGYRIEGEFFKRSIRRYFLPRQNTLRFENRYPTTERMDRQQKVLSIPEKPISAQEIKKECPEVVKRLASGRYDIVLLLPLTPHDFLDIAIDMVPFLKETYSEVTIGLDLQGLTRDVSPQGGPVGWRLSDSLPLLLKQHAVRCAHASIREAQFVLDTLATPKNPPPCPPVAEDADAERIARGLCKQGIDFVGLTDGEQGSWVAWRSPDSDSPPSKHIPTPLITEEARVSYATGAGDTWFGIFAYLLSGLQFPPLAAGCLATQFATIKCQGPDALGSRDRDGTRRPYLPDDLHDEPWCQR
ncbi:MAG: TIR domain-containing protein [Sedimentisphaerales bacterium]|nr:TIR domain-containing protein [Sedimentisphaerales bacterium]